MLEITSTNNNSLFRFTAVIETCNFYSRSLPHTRGTLYKCTTKPGVFYLPQYLSPPNGLFFNDGGVSGSNPIFAVQHFCIACFCPEGNFFGTGVDSGNQSCQSK